MSHEKEKAKLPSAVIFKPADSSVSAVGSLISMKRRLNQSLRRSL